MSRREDKAESRETRTNDPKSGGRRARAAKALRRNLARRKAQARARVSSGKAADDGGERRS